MSIRPASLLRLPMSVQHGLTRVAHATPLTLGAAVLDARLEGRLTRAALHEVFTDKTDDGSAAAGFAILLALRGLHDGQAILWVREDRGVRRCGRLYPQGLAELGIDPAHVLTVHAPNIQALLRAGGDIVKCSAVGAVVIEPHGRAPELDLTASRRLTLAAARSGVMTVALRIGATPAPSAAESRWQVSAAPSTALEGDAPGRPAFDVELLRHRGGIAGFEARVEWNRDTRTFDPSLPRGLSAVPVVRAGEADRRRAA